MTSRPDTQAVPAIVGEEDCPTVAAYRPNPSAKVRFASVPELVECVNAR